MEKPVLEFYFFGAFCLLLGVIPSSVLPLGLFGGMIGMCGILWGYWDLFILVLVLLGFQFLPFWYLFARANFVENISSCQVFPM